MDDTNADVNPQNDTLALIKSAIDNPECQPEKLREMLAFMRDIEAGEALKIFNTAMHAAQSEMPIVLKGEYNEHTKSRFAKLDAVSKLIKPVYIEHGFSISFSEDTCEEPGMMLIIAKVRHTWSMKIAPGGVSLRTQR